MVWRLWGWGWEKNRTSMPIVLEFMIRGIIVYCVVVGGGGIGSFVIL